jgi:hypothetical protein
MSTVMSTVMKRMITMPMLTMVMAACPTDIFTPIFGGEGEGETGTEGEGDTGTEGEGDTGTEGEGEGEPPPIPEGCVGNPAAEATFAVYNGMRESCVGCHGGGTSKPYFASFEGFTNGLVADRSWVVPGDVAGSPLLALLRGQGTAAFTQMPLSGDPFATMTGAGISMEELEVWVTALPANGIACGGVDRAEVHRLPAEVFVASLEVALGYSHDDLRAATYPSATNTDSPDAAAFTESYDTRKADRFRSLGGPHWSETKGRNNELTRSFQLELVQMALGNCRRAIETDNKAALFRFGSRDTGMADQAIVRDNLNYLYTRFLSAVADEEDLDSLLAVFAAAETADNAREGWISSCAALVRDPLFVLY